MRILSVSSGRADIGILAPVWRALLENDGVELHVLLTGAHVSDDSLARAALPANAIAHTAGADIGGREGAEATTAMAGIADAAGRLAAELDPARAIVVGDRLDMLPAAMALMPLNLPIVHIHGGELTLGAVDDRARHAMTKLAHLHCTSTVDAAERLTRMGEEAWRIHVTGAPGLDALMAEPEMDSGALARAIGIPTVNGLRLVTVHPETNASDPLAALDATLAALDLTPGPSLITAPNSDPGGREARIRIDRFLARHGRAVFHETLGSVLYASALRHAVVMVGNSSSGLIEAGLFGLPVINVGRRQDGRVRGPNVCDCAAEAEAIAAMLRDVPPHFPPSSLYGDGHAGPRVAAAVTEAHEPAALLFKRFAIDVCCFTAAWSVPVKR